jgi:hypothetical protein
MPIRPRRRIAPISPSRRIRFPVLSRLVRLPSIKPTAAEGLNGLPHILRVQLGAICCNGITSDIWSNAIIVFAKPMPASVVDLLDSVTRLSSKTSSASFKPRLILSLKYGSASLLNICSTGSTARFSASATAREGFSTTSAPRNMRPGNKVEQANRREQQSPSQRALEVLPARRRPIALRSA